MKRLWLCAALVGWSSLASAVVYKWTGADGKVMYGDRPPLGVHAELVEGLGNHISRYSAPRSQAAAPVQTPKAEPQGPAAGSKEEADKKAVESDVAASKEKQCTEAQARYKQLIEGRHIYKSGPNGEREYMTSEQIDAERLSAKQDVDAVCNSPN